MKAIGLVSSLPRRDGPEASLVKDTDLVAALQDQNQPGQVGHGAATGDHVGDERLQHPGVEPVKGRPGVEHEAAAGVKVIGQGRHGAVLEITSEERGERIV